ncbi:basic leucine zipper transcriptional factor ATF-like 3 [Denticeps clupeoides]|uniref:basic leucine zipper transcriptional factor ATF-like 3 n=1 Tax=Denticeps clupeoides TaxID=299321 RepID=UPI0010A41C60|nr:basic leucine zipper transcriptional factor ATF-like 3 [Denticeps clupeoides]
MSACGGVHQRAFGRAENLGGPRPAEVEDGDGALPVLDHGGPQSDHGSFIRQSSDDEGRKLKRREKNRVAAQNSRKRQTRRADELHEAYESLEQENSSLRKEVQMLAEEQRRLSEALKAHEPLCPIVHVTLVSPHQQ